MPTQTSTITGVVQAIVFPPVGTLKRAPRPALFRDSKASRLRRGPQVRARRSSIIAMRPAQFGAARIFAHPRAHVSRGQNASARIARSSPRRVRIEARIASSPAPANSKRCANVSVAKSRQRASRLLGMIATRRSHSDRRRGCFQAPCRAAKTAERGARGTGTPAGLTNEQSNARRGADRDRRRLSTRRENFGRREISSRRGARDRRGRRARRDSARRAAARRLRPSRVGRDFQPIST